MYYYFTWILFNVILIFGYSIAVPLSDFIAFGQDSGDQFFSGIHRGATPAISISPRLPYFTLTYNNIYVSLVYTKLSVY